MNTKFIRDEHGLRLELMPANDNERTLMSEIMGLTYHKTAKRGLQVLAMPKDNKLVLARPIVFLKKSVILAMGFALGWFGGNGTYFYFLERNGRFYFLKGSGLMNLYIFNRTPPPYVDVSIENGGIRFSSKEYTERWDFSWAIKIEKKIQTASELERSLI